MNELFKEDQFLLIEYQKAQDSAEHYNNAIWLVFSIGIAFSLWIIYTIIAKSEVTYYFKILMFFLGLFILIYSFSLVISNSQKKNRKYQLCEFIEEKNNFIGKGLLKEIPYIKTKYIAEVILSLILLGYIIFPFFYFENYFIGIISILILIIFAIIVFLTSYCSPNKNGANKILERNYKKRYNKQE